MNDERHCADPRVLVVDDHDISRLYTVAALRQIGATVKAVASAEAALAVALRWLPDAVCTDVRLPGACGYELISRIRQGWPSERPPPRFVVLSADPYQSGWAPASPPAAAPLARGVDLVLTKPATSEQLRAALPGGAENRVMESVDGAAADTLQHLFRQELAAQVPALEDSLATQDLQASRAIIHRLLASSRLCGAHRVERCLENLQLACREGADAAGVARSYCTLFSAVSDYLAAAALRSG